MLPDCPLVVFLSSADQQGGGAGCYQTSQMVGSSLRLETWTGESPLGKLVTAVADMSSVGRSSTTTAIAVMVMNTN